MSAAFQCNLCGADCPAPVEPPGREDPGCPSCQSTVRLRSIAALLSRELFGVLVPLPDFPVLRDVRGIGMSDPPELARLIAAKLGYQNTFYHQAPRFDVTRPDPADKGRYDFIISSEVMEHVPAPVEQAFANLAAMLKPDGFLILTVPYRIDREIEEHFPALHEFTLASPGGKTVLLNRRKDGSLEVFEDLCFHGGPGSTLEMRVFSEESLKETLRGAGFSSVAIASESFPEFGVWHCHPWSLPVVARKGTFRLTEGEMAAAYRDARVKSSREEKQWAAERGEYQAKLEAHNQLRHTLESQLAERLEWVRKVETDLEESNQWLRKVQAEFEERTQWALRLQKENEAADAELARLHAAESEAWRRIAALERELGESNAARAAVESRIWFRAARKLKLIG